MNKTENPLKIKITRKVIKNHLKNKLAIKKNRKITNNIKQKEQKLSKVKLKIQIQPQMMLTIKFNKGHYLLVIEILNQILRKKMIKKVKINKN